MEIEIKSYDESGIQSARISSVTQYWGIGKVGRKKNDQILTNNAVP
jgi:hypothetical protein